MKDVSGLKIIDLHCDVLAKLIRYPQSDFNDSIMLDVTLDRLVEANYLLQVFAIYIPDEYSKSIDTFLRAVDLFYTKILNHPKMYWVQTKEDLDKCVAENKIGAVLSIEGVECLEARLYITSILDKLGIQAIGLTWNKQNWAAEGVLANTNTGISNLGKQFVNKLSHYKPILDVSHLSQKSFADLFELYDGPIWASHSNCISICNHPRNLTDEQIKKLINRNSLIGITYVPQFITNEIDQEVNTNQLLSHIAHIIKLGGVDHIALGSDFDGIDNYVKDLYTPSDVVYLQQKMVDNFGEGITEKIMWKNAFSFFKYHLQ